MLTRAIPGREPLCGSSPPASFPSWDAAVPALLLDLRESPWPCKVVVAGGRVHRAGVLSAHQNLSLAEPLPLPVSPALMCVPFFRGRAHLGVWARPLG